MASQSPAWRRAPFKREAWLTLWLVIVFLAYGIANVAYRFTLPTDGWEVSESELPGLAYTEDLLGGASGLKRGDQVIRLAGVDADWQTVQSSSMLRESWRVGETVVYTVLREGVEVEIPVTLVRWRLRQWLPSILLEPVTLVGLLSGIGLLTLATLVFLRRPADTAAGAFLIIVSILFGTRLSETLPSGFSAWIDPTAEFLQNINWYLLLAFLPYGFIQFALAFPRPKPLRQRYPWLAYAAGAMGLLLQVFAAETAIGWYWFVFSLFLAVAVLIHNAITMRDAVSRAQMRWGLGGVLSGFGTIALIFLVGTSGLYADPDVFELAFTLATTIMGVMLATAITRYRLFDIDVIIRKTLVYTVLSGLLGMVYFGSVVVLQTVFDTVSGERSPFIIVIYTLLMAALFAPLRRRVQAFIDRRFYRKKYDGQQVLARFAETARDEMSLEALTAELERVVQETMQPDNISIWTPSKKRG